MCNIIYFFSKLALCLFPHYLFKQQTVRRKEWNCALIRCRQQKSPDVWKGNHPSFFFYIESLAPCRSRPSPAWHLNAVFWAQSWRCCGFRLNAERGEPEWGEGTAEQIMWIIIPGQRPDEQETLTHHDLTAARRPLRQEMHKETGGGEEDGAGF